MQLFKNTVQLRGFLGKGAEVPPSEDITDDAYAVLTLCVESGMWWRPANEWTSRTAWYRIICPGAFFCGFTRGRGRWALLIHHYSSLSFTNPIYEARAINLRRLEIPLLDVIDNYVG